VLGSNQELYVAGKWLSDRQIVQGARIPLKVAIPSALSRNQEKLGQPDGPIADFIRLIRMKRHFVDGDPEPPIVQWIDGWGDLPEGGGGE
jgi:hypothetical protein